ncbi:hypothetical protein LCGC14_0455020 [marine sediment metagenome]|uniref:Uncharacterized protein n=1 Tax=marine sediment metagenome TaxID=412755 RepID=A0A0F9VQI3_9ZZZZ
MGSKGKVLTKISLDQIRMKEFYGLSDEDKPIPAPKCETDKPIGTRDVDKFLREQQNKIWGNE